MAHYTVYWPQNRVEEQKKAGEKGPFKVVLGSIHSRMPTTASTKAGDVVFPVTLMKKKLYVMARLLVTHREPAFDYCLWKLGTRHAALIPKGIAVECQMNGASYYWTWDCKHYNHLRDMPEGARIIRRTPPSPSGSF